MKRYFFLLLTSLFCLTTTVLTASCDEDDWDEDYMEGRWVSTDEPGNEIYLLFDDYHTGSYYEYQNGRPVRGEPYTWEVSHKKIYVTYRDGVSERWLFRQHGRDELEVNFGQGWIPFYRTSYAPWYSSSQSAKADSHTSLAQP